ncbi:hypothetical protein ACSBR1_001111 [Camellia fascicularis]
MGRRGWIPIVKQRRGKEAWSKEPRNELFSVFVDNLPFNMDPKTLFKLFTKFGMVKDVFISQKRRKVTNTRFGFVKYDCSVVANVAVDKKPVYWGQRSNEAGGRKVRSQHGLQRSYVEILKTNARVPVGNVENTIMVDEVDHGWLYGSVILRSKEEYSIHGIEKILKKKGVGDVLVRNG